MTNKTILVTGGTGSFGKAFIRRVLKDAPKKVIVFSRDELKQSEMAKEFKDNRVRFFLGDVRDKQRLDRALKDVDYVVHAAALKQVPAAEYNPSECIKTNIQGSQNVIDACVDAPRVRKVIALSTDKAVNPINLYGATKLCAEKLFVQGNVYSHDTRFACVRYGNVVGSRGSVIPLFKEQAKTGKITITDVLMTRFFITLEQAVGLVLAAFDNMQGGEIFVPRIPSMRVIDLAKAVAPDCNVETIGIRPGEKIHETLISREEAPRTLAYKDRYLIQPNIAEDNVTSWGYEVMPRMLSDGFAYTSDTNDQWLTIADLRRML